MSTEVEISVTTASGESDKPIHHEPVDEGDSDQHKVASPPYNVENNAASDSGVSNASSLTSDYTAPLNNGDIHGLSKPVAVDVPTMKSVEAPVTLKSQSTPVNMTNLSRSFEAVNVDHSSLLEVSETEHGLSMLSLEVMTSGDQLNLIGEDLGDSEGSMSAASRSLSPDMEGEGEGGGVGTPPSAETGKLCIKVKIMY